MSTDAKPQARKRGRPANASKPAVASALQDRPDEYEADVDEIARPKKRGRPKKRVTEDAPEESVEQEDKPRRKRGRPSLEDKSAEKPAEEAAQPKRKRGRPSLEKNPKPKKKRGRPSLEKQNEPEEEQETAENTTRPKKKRGRRAVETDQNDKEPEQEPVEESGKGKRKKSKEKQIEQPKEPEEQPEEEPRPRKKSRKPAQQPEPEETEPAPRKKRQRRAQEEPEPQEEEQSRRSPRTSLNDLGKDANNKGRKGDRARKQDRLSRENVEDQQPDETTKKRGRPKGGRPSAEKSNEPQPEEQEQEQDTNAKKKRRSKNDAPSDSDESLPSPEKPYLHIAPFKRTIRSSTIAAKWTPLSGSSLPAATSILTLAHQPILSRTSTTRNRRTHASSALHLVSRRIERKLARGLPFPPASSTTTTTRRRADADGGRAMELDFEAVLDGKTALDRQLVPARHAVELLKAERDRMEKELDKDYEELRRLEANARAQTRERKDLFRKAHVLAPTSRPTSKNHDTAFFPGIKDEGTLKDLVDTPLEPLAIQLAGHVESIRSNLQQAEGVTPQLNSTKAALQDVLHRYLDSESYEQVVFG
ncbi:CENP-Q a CENPA-CAD centromere complex subunit-domain-containing protein [Fusarium acuminatum]|uniref:CENP-Q a CENPA-CAD centromere complex subunit-domain-containing protein n=1 Tax=Fusarium acuminatum TaxID=5515 RepID=A0ABZ2WRU8_9HYPO